MFRRLLPPMMFCLFAGAAMAQTPPPKGLASLPDPGAPDNQLLAEAGLAAFLEQQCTPPAFLLSGQPIVNCTYWYRASQVVPGRRMYEGQPALYIQKARLELSPIIGENGEDDRWEASIGLWVGQEMAAEPDSEADVTFAGDIASASGTQLTMALGPGAELLVNSHGAIITGLAVLDYAAGHPPEPVRLILQRDGANFDPAQYLENDR